MQTHDTETQADGQRTLRPNDTQAQLPPHREARIQLTFADRTDKEEIILRAATKRNYGWFEYVTGTNGQG